MGFGDICVVQGGAWGSGNASYGDDDGGAARKQDRSVLGGHWQDERDEGIQQGGDGVGVGHCAWGWFWGCNFHGDGEVRSYGMRGYRVGVGDIVAVQVGARGAENDVCGHDGR